ncbi:hypothetical protein GGC64_002139 [Mycobacterium sp. OAS707]|uniref:DNA sulfur modification protein DndB n=1 Tax=Mycobacterium sp. OAS707 TaxID=2663822 RepID=UPI00178B82EA|nr:hypothetical protein [Mycobacterium sp. OAS707]
MSATKNFDFLYGSFRLSKWEIPYFATTVSLKDAAADLRLTSEIPGAENIEWSLNELYQRDIDWPRVERQIVPYLRNSEIPQFFNSITIALLPYDTMRGRLADKFDSNIEWNPPELANEETFEKIIEVGPIKIGTWNSWNSPSDDEFRSGRIRWNTDEVFGVAIDGQHRLAAIKSYVQGAASVANIQGSRIPVIFLLFDEQVGYRGPVDPPTVELLRALFIDLNKHAQTVKRGRQILLDDRDPHAVCVRTLIAERLSDHADSLHGAPPRLPLSLVDWHSEQAKFDVGPYLSTVLGLDWIVIRALDTKPISDWTDYNAIARQITKIESRTGISLASARGRLTELQNLQVSSFSYLEPDLDAIRTAFGEVWRKPIIKLLTEFQPYADLIAQRVEDGSFSMQYQQWYQLYEASQKEGLTGGHATTEYGQFLQRAALDDNTPKGEGDFLKVLKAQNVAKADGGLAFNVVFQRAMVEGFLEYSQFGEAAVNELALEDEGDDIDFGDLAFQEDSEADDSYASEFEAESAREAIADQSEASAQKAEHALKAQYELRSAEYITALNRFLAGLPELLNVQADFEVAEESPAKFWLGSFWKAEGGIDFTQGASTRAKDILFIVAAMCLYDDMREPAEESEFDEFWSTCQDPSSGAVCRKVGRVLKRMTNTDASLGGRILRSQGYSHDPDAAMVEVYNRLLFVWEGIGL